MSLRDLPNPTGPLGADEVPPQGLSLLLAEAERDGHVNGRRIGWLEGLKTGLLFGAAFGAALMLVASCGVSA
jgi:hypothetical protein